MGCHQQNDYNPSCVMQTSSTRTRWRGYERTQDKYISLASSKPRDEHVLSHRRDILTARIRVEYFDSKEHLSGEPASAQRTPLIFPSSSSSPCGAFLPSLVSFSVLPLSARRSKGMTSRRIRRSAASWEREPPRPSWGPPRASRRASPVVLPGLPCIRRPRTS